MTASSVDTSEAIAAAGLPATVGVIRGGASLDRDQVRRILGNLLPALAWSFLLYMQVLRFSFPPALPNLLMAILNSIHVAVFLFRRRSTREGTFRDTLVAFAGTGLIAFMPQASHATALSTSVQLLGLVCWCSSLLTLGRSFGIVPADRGLKSRGPYAIVRHPIYASEMIFYAGLLLAEMSFYALALFVVWVGIQALRMVFEERVIAGYGAYQARVRWRVVPGVW